jgi:hypothetical protein
LCIITGVLVERSDAVWILATQYAGASCSDTELRLLAVDTLLTLMNRVPGWAAKVAGSTAVRPLIMILRARGGLMHCILTVGRLLCAA